LQAEKDLVTYVKNDETRTVDHDRVQEIKNDVHGLVVAGSRGA